MLVWILIAACWAGLLLLILHDVTKDADGRSPVSIASRNAVITVRKGWRRLRKLRRRLNSPKAVASEAPAQTSLATVSPEAATELSKTEPSKKNWWRREQRAPISPAELEHTINEAIRKTAPECGSFVGVIVHHKKPKQSRDPNWGVRGIKYGKADRRLVEETLADIVKQLQKEFRLTDPQLRN
jgi:hypothetical protein